LPAVPIAVAAHICVAQARRFQRPAAADAEAPVPFGVIRTLVDRRKIVPQPQRIGVRRFGQALDQLPVQPLGGLGGIAFDGVGRGQCEHRQIFVSRPELAVMVATQ